MFFLRVKDFKIKTAKMTRNDTFFSLDEIEKDFDKSMISLDQTLVSHNLIKANTSTNSTKAIDNHPKKDNLQSNEKEHEATRACLSTIASSFATLFQYTLTLAELNAKLEAELIEGRNRVLEQEATLNSHSRIEEELVLQLHTAKLDQMNNNKSQPTEISNSKSTDSSKSDKSATNSISNDTKSKNDKIRDALEEQIDQRKQFIRADEKVISERNHLRDENEYLRNLVAKSTNDLYAARLTSKYLDKELAGRIQQIQLIGKGKMSSENFGKLWTQLESEIFLHRQKTLIQACRANHLKKNDNQMVNQEQHQQDESPLENAETDENTETTDNQETIPQQPQKQTSIQEKLASTPTPEPQKIREVKFIKNENNLLGMSITGGNELGVPIIISDLKKDGVAANTGQLVIGDAILSINGMSLSGLSHTEAAAVLSNASGEICLEVQYLMTDD